MIHALFLVLLLAVGQVNTYDQPFFNKIGEELLKGHTVVNEKPSEKPIVEQGLLVNAKKLFKSWESNFVPLSRPNALNKVFGELGLGSDQLSIGGVIDHTTIQELEMIRGGSETAANTLLRSITASYKQQTGLTVIGEKKCAEMLCAPLSDSNDLKVRRDIIKALSSDATLLQELSSSLQTMKESEQYILDFYGKDGISDAEKAAYPTALTSLMGLDEVPTIISCTNRMFAFMLSPLWMPTCATIGTVIAVTTALWPHYDPNDPLYPQAAFLASTIATAAWAQNTNPLMLKMQALFLPLSIPNMGVAKSIAHAIMDMQERVIGVSTYMRAAKQVTQMIDAHPELAVLMPQAHAQLQKLSNQDDSVSAKYAYLNALLHDASTFDAGDPSYFSSPGNILVAYKYLSDKAIRSEYASVVNFIGEIDTYAALANKINMHAQYNNAPFCFVEFIDQSEKPELVVNEFWHPFVDPAHVVSNSVALNNGSERNMIITGPNTGGKSTNMKALALSVLLAQTFGIAPAASMQITPFSVLCSYLNITDDTSAGLSLFKAEVKRVQAIMDAIKGLSKGQYAFVMFDEIFTGTSPDKAEQLSFECMKKCSEYERVIFVTATHFKKLTELEKVTHGLIKNYQVGVITDEHGQVVQYTYKLVPGISQINSAQQVAEETGLTF